LGGWISGGLWAGAAAGSSLCFPSSCQQSSIRACFEALLFVLDVCLGVLAVGCSCGSFAAPGEMTGYNSSASSAHEEPLGSWEYTQLLRGEGAAAMTGVASCTVPTGMMPAVTEQIL
jgi:hypothetical protein